MPKSVDSKEGGGIWRAGVCGLLFLGTLAAAALGLRAGLPERTDIPVVSEKLAVITEQAERVDTLFIGSSRVFHQLDPEVFDARMAELGRPTRSYNFGVDGMGFPETFYMLERALARAPRLLEVGALQRQSETLLVHGSLRSIYWRDVARTARLLRAAWRDPAPTPQFREKQVDWLGEQFVLAIQNCANLGRGAAWMEAWLKRRSAPPRKLRTDGFLPIDRRMSAADEVEFRAGLARRRRNAELPLRADPELREHLARLAGDLRERGGKLHFGLMPAVRKFVPDLPREAGGQSIPLLEFDDPVAHPELFRAENYYDPAHLNAAGSPLLTRLTAETVAKHLAGMQ